VQIYGREIVFSTEDGYSGRWFFPRYDGWIHEPKTTELLARLSQEAENIIDVGANLGWFSCIAASISDGTVHAFEMDEDNLHLLNTNITLNGLQNVSVNHAAVTNSKGHVSYWKEPGSAGVAHSFVRENEGKQERVQVEATTLDRYTEDHCQSVELIKIDVEGAAQKVLEGGQRTIREDHPHILLEVHPVLLESSGTLVQAVLGELPDTYRIYHVEGFSRGDQEVNRQRIDPSVFAPNHVSMLHGELSDRPLRDFPTLSGSLFEFT
jgi:FkbM family methyltransferase